MAARKATSPRVVLAPQIAGVAGPVAARLPDPDFGTDHAPVDYAAIAAAAGIHAVRIEQPTEIRSGLADALAPSRTRAGRPGHRPKRPFDPPHLTAAEVKGFALGAAKVVLEGGVGRMLDLARANLRNIPRPSVIR
jgi:pyruvate dehydrogenase (quinone)